MQGVSNIFQSIANLNPQELKIFLKSIADHQSFRYNESNNNAIVQSITSLLSQSSTRYAGLLILKELLKQITFDVLEQKGVLWTTLCTKVCGSREQSLYTFLAYDVLNQIIQKSVNIPDLSKAFSSHLLNKIFETLNNITATAHLSALKLIETCLKLYSGPCSQFRNIIEKFIYPLIDNEDEKVVSLCGKCLHLLQQIRGSGMHGISYKNAWQTYQLKLLGSLHEVLEIIYSNCSDVYDENIEIERLQVKPLELSNEPIYRASQLFTRFKNLMKYLEIAIKEPFSVSKCIMPKKIFNLISRVLAVNCKILEKNPIQDNLAIGALLPQIHIRCFKLINVMIQGLQSNLALYYKKILNFVMETLKWTSFGKSIGFCKPYNSLRIAAYKTLSLWCETMKNGSECQIIEETLIEQIIFDITPFQNELTLKVLSGSKKHMSKKARRLLHKAQNEQTHLIQAHSRSVDPQITKKEFSDEGNEEVCIASLNCLKCVLSSSGHSLKPQLVKEIYDKILEICIQLTNKNCYQNGKFLYSNRDCRRKLYCLACSFTTTSHYLCPPPIQLIITLINRAQINDDCTLIREDCNLYMRNLETIIHPHKDNLNFPNDLNEIKKVLRKNRKDIEEDDDDGNDDDKGNDDDDDDDDNENNIRFILSDSKESEKEGGDVIATTGSQKELNKSSLESTSRNNEVEKNANNDHNQENFEISNTIHIEQKKNDGKSLNELEKSEKSVPPKDALSKESENVLDDVIDLDDDNEPVIKKARISEKEKCETQNDSQFNENKEMSQSENLVIDLDKEIEINNENDLVEEMAKTFINELNEESN